MFDAGEVLPNTVTVMLQIGGSNGATQTVTASATASVAVCIHGSSLIKLANGTDISISELKPWQEIIGADGKINSIVEAVPCWAGVYDTFFGKCIIFEPDSLEPGIPFKRFAVDAGHPICTPEEYIKNRDSSLQPAKTYLGKNKGIYEVTWDAVASLLPGKNKRFDIIMSENSCKAYNANGIIVKARLGRKLNGYSYE
jgi:hypothetical protein